MGDAVAEGALVGHDVSGSDAYEEVHVRAFGEEGADTGPGVVVRDGRAIGQDIVTRCEGVPAFFDV